MGFVGICSRVVVNFLYEYIFIIKIKGKYTYLQNLFFDDYTTTLLLQVPFLHSLSVVVKFDSITTTTTTQDKFYFQGISAG